MNCKNRSLKSLLTFGLLTLSLNAYSKEVTTECKGADIFILKISYDSEKATKELSSISLSVGDKETPTTLLADAKQVPASEVRPGVIELGDLENSAMLEFVIDEKTFNEQGKYFFSGADMNDVSLVAMPDGSSLANLALILGSKDANGSRIGHLISLDCK